MSTLKNGSSQANNAHCQLFENLMTKSELAQALRISPSFINKLMAKEGLPRFPIGRAVRFRVSEVEAWLQRRHEP